MGKNGSSVPNANVEQLVMKVFISLVMDNNLQIYLAIFYIHQLEFLQDHQK